MISSYGQDSHFNQVGSNEFRELITNNQGILLDVRTNSEFKNGHIGNAGNLNYYALDFRKKLNLLPKDQAIYLYCNTGYRSKKAAEILVQTGYTNVYNLQQGIMEWELYDLPLIIEPDADPDTENKIDPDYYHTLIRSNPLVFFDFYAPWCGPCLRMMPLFDSLKLEYQNDILFIKVNVDASKRLVKERQLTAVPYFVLFKDGEEAYSWNGMTGRSELKKSLSNILN